MRTFLILGFFVLLSPALFAQHALQLENRGYLEDETFSFSIGLDTGMFLGMINEWVFYDRNGDGIISDTISRLDWQVNPIFYIGVTGSVEFIPRFFFGFGAWLGIPGLIGYMEDRDWDPATGIYSIFSHHDNLLKSAQFADVNVGYSLVYDESLIFNAIIGFHFQHFYLSGQNGYQENPPGSDPPTSVYSWEVISYDLYYFTPYLAVEGAWTPGSILTADLFLAVSPFLTFVYAHDHHWMKADYLDFPRFGFTFSGVLSFSFHLGNGLDLRIKNSIIWTPPMRIGDSYEKPYLSDYYLRYTDALGSTSRILYGLSISIVTGGGW